MPLDPVPTTRFKQEAKLYRKRGKDMGKLHAIIEDLRHHRPLDPKHKDHALSGIWKDFRDCHVEPDWILIYQQNATELILARTGTHSDLFGKNF